MAWFEGRSRVSRLSGVRVGAAAVLARSEK